MLQKTIFLALAILLIGGASAQASVTTEWRSGADAYTLQTQFLSAPTTQTEDFEGFAHGTTPTLNIAFGTLTGGGYVSDSTGMQSTTGEYAVSGDKFFSNGDLNSYSTKHDFTVNLNTPQNALGFFALDWQDIGGKVTLGLGAGANETIDIGTLVGAQSNGSLIYFTLFSTVAFDSITFHKSSNDGYAIDDLSVAATPIPGAAWLLGSGLIGLVGLRRRMQL